MWKTETYSSRLRRAKRGNKPEVYQYEEFPQPFRVQVTHIWHTAIGPYYAHDSLGIRSEPLSNKAWRTLHDSFAREIGVFELGERGDDPFYNCQEFLMKADTLQVLDIIEWTFRYIDKILRRVSEMDRRMSGIVQNAEDAIEELNHRFRQSSIGYQFVGGEIVRVDSQYLHSEVVKPAIQLLQQVGFAGATEEFLRAHDHYRNGRCKEAISEALKSFESTMKSICDSHGWKYPKNATSKTLIDTLLQNGLIPKDLESHFSGLRAAMETGLPTIRNRLAGHGQGAKTIEVPEYLAAYALHLAGSNIVFLVEAHCSMK